MNFLKDANPFDLLKEIKTKSPLVWNISNFVSMDIAANMLLAVGASPAMAHALEEAEDFSNICKAINGALTINIGTFDSHWQSCAINVAKQARLNDVPWVLDPVGAGASKFRSKNALELLKHNPTVLRGNASEIISLSGISTTGKGVDSTSSSNEALDAAKLIASNNKTIVAVTGEIDYITSGSKTYTLKSLINESNTKWNEPEWGFPKGRRNYQEKDLHCALREFEEETGYPKTSLKIIQNLNPFEEIFTGSNYKSYKHRYYIAYMDSNNIQSKPYQKTEVSKVEWQEYDKVLNYIRPYNIEKQNIIKNINKLLNSNKLYQ